MSADCIHNSQPGNQPLSVLCPSGKRLISIHTANYNLLLPPDTKRVNVFKYLASGLLISICQLCDTGCEA